MSDLDHIRKVAKALGWAGPLDPRLFIGGGHDVFSLDQDSFRGRNDDGSETAATWKAAANTNWTQDVDENFRVRFLVQEVGAGEASDFFQAYRGCQYNLNSAGWNQITIGSSVVKLTLSSNFADLDATTQQIGSGTFVAGAMFESSGAKSINLTGVDDETEVEYCLQIVGADVSDADTLQLMVVGQVSTWTVLDVYTNIPSITVNKPVGVTVTPSPASAVGATVNPPVVKGSLVITGGAVSSVAAKVDPTVVKGPLSITPNPAAAIAAKVDPTVAIGQTPITPTPVSGVAATGNPTVILGSDTFVPNAASSNADRLSPNVIKGSLNITSTPASALAEKVDPVILISGGGIFVSPDPAGAVAERKHPSVIQGPIVFISDAASSGTQSLAPGVVLGSIIINFPAAEANGTASGPNIVLGGLNLTPVPGFAVASFIDPTVELSVTAKLAKLFLGESLVTNLALSERPVTDLALVESRVTEIALQDNLVE